ncbi:MAG: hypothetical protein LBG62_05850 [Candidatus Methanoplasma sp.]|nr:hypothetical protein [Candidatus Methanoplasma sp.]
MSFCVRCGREAEQTSGGLCAECFIGGRRLTDLPHHVNLLRCSSCGEFQKGESWISKPLAEAVEDAAVDSLGVIREARLVSVGARAVEQDPYNFLATVESVLEVGGFEATEEATVAVRVKNTVCKRCSRQLGSYYESILQIRAGRRDAPASLVREAMARVEGSVAAQARTNRQLFITKSEEVPGGVDVYLSSISLGKSLAKEVSDAYCAETKEAAKLVGQTRDGLDMYRVTYLVRLPDYQAGDAVSFDGRHYKLTRVSASGGKILDLVTFRERAVGRTDMRRVKVHEKASDMRLAAVVSRSAREIQVLDPSDCSIADLRVPEGEETGDEVRVTEIDGALYYVP